MNKSEFDIELPASSKRRRLVVYLKMIFWPAFIYGLFVAGFFYDFGIKIDYMLLALMAPLFFVALIFTTRNAEFSCAIFEIQQADFKRELKDYILKSLLTIGKKTKSNSSFDDFIANYCGFIRNDSYSNIGAATFALLGIFGVFVYISLLLPELSFDEGFELSVSALLKALASAFFLAVYGIFLSLWWVFFERAGEARFARIINRQKLATKSFFWGKEELERHYMEQNLQSSNQISTIFGYVNENIFFDELGKVIERKFNNFTNLLKAEEEATKASSEHLKYTMNMLQKTQKEQKDIVRVYSDIINALNTFNQNLKEMQLELAKNFLKAQSLNDEKASRLEKSVLALSVNISSFEHRLDSFNAKLFENQSLVLDDFKESIKTSLYELKKGVNNTENQTDKAPLSPENTLKEQK